MLARPVDRVQNFDAHLLVAQESGERVWHVGQELWVEAVRPDARDRGPAREPAVQALDLQEHERGVGRVGDADQLPEDGDAE
jgi:hypothetical protein